MISSLSISAFSNNSKEKQSYIAFRVKGTSMEPVLHNGAFILVRPDKSPRAGDFVVLRKKKPSLYTCFCAG